MNLREFLYSYSISSNAVPIKCPYCGHGVARPKQKNLLRHIEIHHDSEEMPETVREDI